VALLTANTDGSVSSNHDFIDPAVQGTLEILKSIKAYAPTVKRVVLTSSCASVIDFAANPISSPQRVYTEKDWNPITLEAALAGTPNNAYQASKKFAEKAGMLPTLAMF
jgi:nucleoside-diphosphate-sugar epimerase